MGASLSKAAQWTTAGSGTGKLESTPMNESLLKEILHFVEQFSSRHPQEAEHVFEEPLQWSTTLVASDFKTDYDISDSNIQSHEKDGEGRPLLQLSPPTVYVRSFSQLSKLVQLADDKKLEEVQACLEENRDPVVKILGPSFGSILEKQDAHTNVLVKEEDQGQDSEVKVKLFLLLQNMDNQLLNKCLREIAGQVGLDSAAVKNEVELLKWHCSAGEKMVLKSVRYTSDYVFSNGCRAPPWRQALNEICYLVIEPCDTETLYITCSTAGVFLNGGIKQEGEEGVYERTSDMYKDLGTLLRSRSPHFAENINKQDFAVQELPSTQKIQHVESVDAEEQGQPQRSYEQQEKNVHVHVKARLQHILNRMGLEKKYEPCPRWKNLGLPSLCGKAEETKPSTSSGEEKEKLGPGAKSKMKAEFSVSSLPGCLSSQKIKAQEKKPGTRSGEENKMLGPGAKSKMKAEFPVSSLPGCLSSQKIKAQQKKPGTRSGEENKMLGPGAKSKMKAEFSVSSLPGCLSSQKIKAQQKKPGTRSGEENKMLGPGAKSKMKAEFSVSSLPGCLSSQKIKAQEKKPGTRSGEENKMLGPGANSKMKAEFPVSSLPGCLSSQKIKTPAGSMPVDAFSESSSESEEEPDRRPERNKDLPSDYWQIQKLVKYLKEGDQTATLLILCAMMDLNLMQETCQLAIWDLGGLEVLVNLLDTDEVKCKIGSLKILTKLSHNMQISRAIVDMEGLQSIMKNLDTRVKDLKALAAETIAIVVRFSRARRIVRQYGGIQKLVKLLDCIPNVASLTVKQEEKDVEVARCGALALWSCSKSTKNKVAIRKAGGIPLLERLLKSPHENMLIPVVGTLQECASEESYRIAIQTEGIIKDLVKILSSNNDELQMHCANIIFKCAEDKQTRDLVHKYKGLQLLVSLLSKADNKQLLAAATGAIWKCSISMENVAKFQEYQALETLVGLLTHQSKEILVNVVGALGEFAQLPDNQAAIRRCGGIRALVNLLTGTNHALLVNVTKAVGAYATDVDNMAIIEQLDGIRLVWSLLKNPNADVQSSAAWALCPCIENAKDAGEMARSLVGGLQLIVKLLKSTNNEVLASICAAIAKIAKDKESLAILTDHGVVPLLAKLTNTTDDRLRRHLAEAISHCCVWGNNRASFGDAGAVAPLVRYLKSKDKAVHQNTAVALYHLSKDPNNCITMHERGVVKPLIHFMGSDDEMLQEAAAGCVRNIRMLVQANRNTL